MTTYIIKAQSNGLVLDQDTLPIEGVNVLLVDQNLLLKTDENGIFLMKKNIPDN